MVASTWLMVEVVYADVNQQWSIPLKLPVGSNVQTALEASGLLCRIGGKGVSVQNLQDEQMIGVWGQQASLTTGLSNRDRVEIYRPLQVDPKQARKRRADVKRRKRSTLLCTGEQLKGQ